jgi:hypothetical protein
MICFYIEDRFLINAPDPVGLIGIAKCLTPTYSGTIVALGRAIMGRIKPVVERMGSENGDGIAQMTIDRGFNSLDGGKIH